VTSNLAEMSVVKSRTSVPQEAIFHHVSWYGSMPYAKVAARQPFIIKQKWH